MLKHHKLLLTDEDGGERDRYLSHPLIFQTVAKV